MQKLERLVAWATNKTPGYPVFHSFLRGIVNGSTLWAFALSTGWTLFLYLQKSDMSGWYTVGILIGTIAMIVTGVRLLKATLKVVTPTVTQSPVKARTEELLARSEEAKEGGHYTAVWLKDVRGWMGRINDPSFDRFVQLEEEANSLAEGSGDMSKEEIISETVGILKNVLATGSDDVRRHLSW